MAVIQQQRRHSTYLDIASYSMGLWGGASKDMRYRLRSMGASGWKARLLVLRFLGSDSGGASLPRPLSSWSLDLSASERESGQKRGERRVGGRHQDRL